MKENKMDKDYNLGEKIGSMQSDIAYIKNTIDSFTREAPCKYVTKEEFKPYKVILGFIGIAILSFIVNDVLEYYTKTRNNIIRQQTKSVDNK